MRTPNNCLNIRSNPRPKKVKEGCEVHSALCLKNPQISNTCWGLVTNDQTNIQAEVNIELIILIILEIIRQAFFMGQVCY